MKRIQPVSKRGLGTVLLMALLGMLAPPIMAGELRDGKAGLLSAWITKQSSQCYLLPTYPPRVICYS